MSRDPHALTIGRLTAQDLPAALALQSEAYPAFLVEGKEAFASRLDVVTSYCLAAKAGDTLLGYLLAHGWPRQSPPSVGAVLPQLVPNEVLFIHDLAVSSLGHGLDIGRSLVTRAFELATQDGLRTAELIAVQGAATYWRKLGFIDGPASRELRAKILDYGADARWMVRDLQPAWPPSGLGR